MMSLLLLLSSSLSLLLLMLMIPTLLGNLVDAKILFWVPSFWRKRTRMLTPQPLTKCRDKFHQESVPQERADG